MRCGPSNEFDCRAEDAVPFAIRSRGSRKRVLTAMENVDRGLFVKGIFSDRAYEDMPLPIECGQTISQPSVVGIMTQALNITPRDTVLEVGTGSGYQTVILSQLARRVYTIERYKRLVMSSKLVFEHLKTTNIISLYADGSRGLPDQAPFDKIILTAAAEDPPGPLWLNSNWGHYGSPVGQSDAVQRLIKVTRSQTGFDYEDIRDVRFVPLVEGLGKDG